LDCFASHAKTERLVRSSLVSREKAAELHGVRIGADMTVEADSRRR